MVWRECNVLVSDEHLECADDLGESNGLVGLPVVRSLDIVDKDDKVLVLALVVALDQLSFSASHDC